MHDYEFLLIFASLVLTNGLFGVIRLRPFEVVGLSAFSPGGSFQSGSAQSGSVQSGSVQKGSFKSGNVQSGHRVQSPSSICHFI